MDQLPKQTTTIARLDDLLRAEKRKGLTTNEIARSAGVAASTFSEIRNGDIDADKPPRQMRAETLVKVCRYFNVSADYMLGLTDVKSQNQTTQSIHRATGLSEKAIENLRSIKRTPEAGLYFINALLEDSQTLYAFSSLINDILHEEKTAATDHGAYKRNISRYIECLDILRSMTEKLLDCDEK